MSEFFDKYAGAPAIRTLTADEVEVGMVVRTVKESLAGNLKMWVLRVKYEGLPAITEADRIELLEDVPDPRDELAKRLCCSLDWDWDCLNKEFRDRFLRMADEAMRWADEQGGSR